MKNLFKEFNWFMFIGITYITVVVLGVALLALALGGML